MTNLSKILTWLDNHILLIWTVFLLAFVPLWPKIPLFSPIEQYIVRVRLEDIAVLLAGLTWFVQLLRGKVRWRHPVVGAIGSYVLVGLVSLISAVLITQTIPFESLHLGKSALHWFRYIEYFSLLVIALSAVTKKSHLKVVVVTLVLTVIAVAVYGYGQKNYYWPVYSTMNREFSKGVRLVLTEHARVQSTFSGHYDLGGWLVIMLPVLLGIVISVNQRWFKFSVGVGYLAGLWLLVVSASRTSLAAFIVASWLVVVLLAILKKQGWWARSRWFLQTGLLVTAITGLTIFSFGQDVYDRFLQVIEGYPSIHRSYHLANGIRKDNQQRLLTNLGLTESSGLSKADLPENAISIDQERIIVASDQRPVPTGTSSKPGDVFIDVPDIEEVEVTKADGTTSIVKIDKGPRTYSECALRYGLSLCIRLDALWPQAWQGFLTNPLLGKGYATLNKTEKYQFTEADSTDNNYLRTLGETGLLGTVSFYGVILVTGGMVARFLLIRRSDQLTTGLLVGYLAGSAGLLLNAVYIDVYAASKIALSYWALTGVILAVIWIETDSQYSLLPERLVKLLPHPWQKLVVSSPSHRTRNEKKG